MFLNMITFFLTTYFYYNSLKPKLSYEILTNSSKYVEYMKKYYVGLAVYFLLIVIVQFFINTYAITSNCGGVMTENLSAAALLTFIPWGLIFGAVVLVLTIFPGFKGAFSNVVGYYVVSNDANHLLTTLLLNQNMEKAMNNGNSKTGKGGTIEKVAPSINQQASINMTGGNTSSDISELTDPTGINSPNGLTGKSETQRLEDAADAIVKICGNTSILINQIVPSNFAKYWNVLDPLMKPKYRNNSPDGIGMRVALFELCSKRDDIGEALWYIYTGILVCSVVQMKIANRGCESDLQTMEQKYQAYKQEEQAELAAKSKIHETEYTTTN